jgi:hypothetical protein
MAMLAVVPADEAVPCNERLELIGMAEQFAESEYPRFATIDAAQIDLRNI